MGESDLEKIVPFKQSKLSKKEQIAGMFDRIAFRYDFLNHFMSLGIDRIWRRKALNYLKDLQPEKLLDVAAGTADFAILAAERLKPQEIKGIDISKEMLAIGRKKVEKKGLTSKIELLLGDSEQLSFEDDSFDAVTSAFGVRNFEHLEVGLKEMCRVTRKGGKTVILDFSMPSTFPVKQIYRFYFRYITPRLGKWIGKNEEAYSYLPESVDAFPQGEKMIKILRKAGFKSVIHKSLTFGVCAIYCATK